MTKVNNPSEIVIQDRDCSNGGVAGQRSLSLGLYSGGGGSVGGVGVGVDGDYAKYEDIQQYSHSEGYSSYVPSESSYVSVSATPLLDQLRRDNDVLVKDVKDAKDAKDGHHLSQLIHSATGWSLLLELSSLIRWWLIHNSPP